MRKNVLSLTLAAALSLGLSTPAAAQDARPPRGESAGEAGPPPRAAPGRRDFREQDRAFELKESGRALPLPVLQRRVGRTLPDAEFIGTEFRGDRYRLKFMEGGRVIWVDVDSQSGRIIGRSD